MKIATRAGLPAIVLFFLAQSWLYAWGNTTMGLALEQAIKSARGRAGVFRYNAALQVNGGYDADIYFGTLDKPVPDSTFFAGPNIQVFLPLKKRVVFDISESPRYVFYLRTERERALNNTLAGRVHVVFDKVYIQVGAGLTNAKQRLSSELNMNIRLKEDYLSGLIFWQASKRTACALQYQRSNLNFVNSDVQDNLNRTESSANLVMYIEQGARARFYVDGEYGSYAFTDRALSFKDSRSYGVYAGVEFLPPVAGYEGQISGIRGRINMGYKRLDILDPLQEDNSGLAGDIGISLEIMKLTALRLFFSRGPQFSAYSGRTYFLQTAYGAGIGRSLARNILFTYDYGYSRNDYPGVETAGGNPAEKSADRYATHSFMLNFRMRRDLQFSLLANLGRRNSKLAPRAASNRAFFGFSLTYGYSAGGLSMPTGPLS
jgi:hypothetical protein